MKPLKAGADDGTMTRNLVKGWAVTLAVWVGLPYLLYKAWRALK